MEKNKQTQNGRSALTAISEVLLPRFPNLKKKLLLANMKEEPVDFLEKVVKASLFASMTLLVVSIFILLETNSTLLWIPLLIVLYPLLTFGYFGLYPDATIFKRKRELDYEVVFAGRHLVIALKSGMPLFDAMVGTSRGYGEVSKEIAKIVDKVVLGTPITHAIRDAVHYNPSKYFVRILMQIANSLSSGADVGNSVETVLDQISKEQMIQLKEYSQKLTPVVMFYMVFGIIVPSLGIVLLTVIFSAISGGKLGLTSAILIPAFLGISIVQFLFLGIVESSRPKYLI